MTPRRRTLNEKTTSQSLNTKSTGEILRQAREARGESLQEVSVAIQVRPSMLRSIESGQFFGLTDPLYLKGFIRAYAVHVGLDENEVLPFFRREYDEQRTQQQKLNAPIPPMEAKRFKVGRGRVLAGVLTVALLAVIGFSYNQYVSVALTPPLELHSPNDNMESRSGFVEIAGKTEAGATLLLNGQEVDLSPDGSFSLTVAVAPGANTLALESTNSLGKVTRLERRVLGVNYLASTESTSDSLSPTPTVLAVAEERKQPHESSASADLSKVEVVLRTGDQPSWVEVVADGKKKFAGMMLPGVTQVFTGLGEVSVRSGNAGSTSVEVNGKDLGAMGKQNQVVEKVYKSSGD